VHPGHARKFAARMIEQKHKLYYFEEIEGGHSAGADLIQAAEHEALEFTYLSEQLVNRGN
jgi:prolyl oligopeptidase